MVSIKCGNTTADFCELGAELKSLKCGKNEYIWQGDKRFWGSSSPILFPICSSMIDDTYYFEGKKYNMPKHGFACSMEFSVESKSESQVTFLLCDNEETKKYYPFSFEFRVHYVLKQKKLSVKYEITNKNDFEMFFSVGAHEGYSCVGGIEDYDIILPKKTNLKHSCLATPTTLGYEKADILNNEDTIHLNYDYFKKDGLIFENIDFDSLILKNRKNGESIRVTFKQFPYLLLWTVANAPYICIEPWCGITDKEDSDQNIKTKDGIEHLLPYGTFTREHSIEIISNN